MFFAFVVSINAQTLVDSLEELRSAVQNSNQTIKLQAGTYNITDIRDNDDRFFLVSGNNNTIDLTGTTIFFPVEMRTPEAHFYISGRGNTILGGRIENNYDNGATEITDFVSYNTDRSNLANGGKPHMVIAGNDTNIIGTEIIVRGSFPYGYGSYFGINGHSSFGLEKRGGIQVNSTNTLIDGVYMQMDAFGHGIYIGPGEGAVSDNTIIRNTTMIGQVRLTNDMLAESGPDSLMERNNYKDVDGNDIPANEAESIGEDGIRAYGDAGDILVENCIVRGMRSGVRLLFAGGDTRVVNTIATDNRISNYDIYRGGSIEGSTANFTYGPALTISRFHGGQEVDLTLEASPEAVGDHDIANIERDVDVTFRRVPGSPLDDNEERVIRISAGGVKITNYTEYTILLEEGTSGNEVISCGRVIDNGSNNVTLGNDCNFDFDGEVEVEEPVVEEEIVVTPPVDTTPSFTPDPSKTYYIDSPVHDLRIGATGNSEDPFTTSTGTTGSDVEWQFTSNGDGSWYIDRAEGGRLPRLRTDATELADLQSTASDGRWESFIFTEGAINDTHFITSSNGPEEFRRLQIDNEGVLKMTPDSYDGTWESFTFTEVEESFVDTVIEEEEPITGSSTVVHITKRNARGFALDGNFGGENGQDVYLWEADTDNRNQQWIEIDRGNGYYSYQKMGTDYCIDGGNNGENNQNVYLWDCGINNYNQHWEKVSTSNGAFKLVKRNASGFALDGDIGGANGQSVELYNSEVSSHNLQWYITPINGLSAKSLNFNTTDVIIYPNPVATTATIQGAVNTTVRIYDMNGKVVLVKNVVSDSETIDLSSLSSGVYYTQVNGLLKTTVFKVIKE